MTALRVLSCPTCAPIVFRRPAVQARLDPSDPDAARFGLYVVERARWIVRHPERLAGVEIRGDGRLAGWSWIGHRAITGDREWQATSIDADGPVGDCRRADLGVALDDQGAAGAVVALVALARPGPA